MGRKKIPTVGVFPTVLVFSYGQINPTVKFPRLGCTQFVVPPGFKVIFSFLSYLTLTFIWKNFNNWFLINWVGRRFCCVLLMLIFQIKFKTIFASIGGTITLQISTFHLSIFFLHQNGRIILCLKFLFWCIFYKDLIVANIDNDCEGTNQETIRKRKNLIICRFKVGSEIH